MRQYVLKKSNWIHWSATILLGLSAAYFGAKDYIRELYLTDKYNAELKNINLNTDKIYARGMISLERLDAIARKKEINYFQEIETIRKAKKLAEIAAKKGDISSIEEIEHSLRPYQNYLEDNRICIDNMIETTENQKNLNTTPDN